MWCAKNKSPTYSTPIVARVLGAHANKFYEFSDENMVCKKKKRASYVSTAPPSYRLSTCTCKKQKNEFSDHFGQGAHVIPKIWCAKKSATYSPPYRSARFQVHMQKKRFWVRTHSDLKNCPTLFPSSYVPKKNGWRSQGVKNRTRVSGTQNSSETKVGVLVVFCSLCNG